jgi:hypothetical protein
VNTAQLRLASHALEQRNSRRRDSVTRLGYFSGTRTHQADFRIVYPALMKLLSERTDARLLIVGDLDLGEFPGLLPYLDAIETLAIRPWSELPAILVNVDINVIPLEVTPFNEGKSTKSPRSRRRRGSTARTSSRGTTDSWRGRRRNGTDASRT